MLDRLPLAAAGEPSASKLGLGERVRRGAGRGRARAGRDRERRGGAGHVVVVVVVTQRQAGDGRVAGVGHEVAVGDRAGRGQAGRRGGLGDRHRGGPGDRDVEGVGGLRRLGGIGRGRVGQAAAGVDLGLGDRVAAGVGPGLGQLELAVGVRVTRGVDRPGRVAPGVGDGDARERHVAVVGDREGVGHDLAGRGDRRRGGRLGDRHRGALVDGDVQAVGGVRRLGRGGRDRVGQVAAGRGGRAVRVELGLGERVRREQVVVEPAPGATASVVAAQAMSSLSLSSLSDRPVMVALPVLVTR